MFARWLQLFRIAASRGLTSFSCFHATQLLSHIITMVVLIAQSRFVLSVGMVMMMMFIMFCLSSRDLINVIRFARDAKKMGAHQLVDHEEEEMK
jgi:hypothetical protein